MPVMDLGASFDPSPADPVLRDEALGGHQVDHRLALHGHPDNFQSGFRGPDYR